LGLCVLDAQIKVGEFAQLLLLDNGALQIAQGDETTLERDRVVTFRTLELVVDCHF